MMQLSNQGRLNSPSSSAGAGQDIGRWCHLRSKDHLLQSVHQPQPNLNPNPLAEIPRDKTAANVLGTWELLELTTTGALRREQR